MSDSYKLLFFQNRHGDLRIDDVVYNGTRPPTKDYLLSFLVDKHLLALPAPERPMWVHAVDSLGHVVAKAGVQEHPNA